MEKQYVLHIMGVLVALCIQDATRMRHIVMSPPRIYDIFSTIFEKKKLLNTKRVLIFSTTFVWNIFHLKKN